MVLVTLRTLGMGQPGWLATVKASARILILAMLCSPLASAEVRDDSPRHEIPLLREFKGVIDRVKQELENGGEVVRRAIQGQPAASPKAAAPKPARKAPIQSEGETRLGGDAGPGAIPKGSQRKGDSIPSKKKPARQRAADSRKKGMTEPTPKVLPQQGPSPTVKSAAHGQPDSVVTSDGRKASEDTPGRTELAITPERQPPSPQSTASIKDNVLPTAVVVPATASAVAPRLPSGPTTGVVSQPLASGQTGDTQERPGVTSAQEAKPSPDALPGANAVVTVTQPRQTPIQESSESQPAASEAVAAAWQDCENCPEYVPIDTTAPDRGRLGFVALGMTKNEITFAQYDEFCAETHRVQADDAGWGRGSRPVINVSLEDATLYAAWLSNRTAVTYRLPTDAEWERAARAGTATHYWWGDEVGRNRANCANCGCEWDGRQTAPVGSFKPNPWGLNDTVGNVWEWIDDRYSPYRDGWWPIIRGGSWSREATAATAAYRVFNSAEFRRNNLGFRLARAVEHPGHLRLTVNVPARIRVNGQAHGEVRPEKPLLLLNLNAGQYRIEAQAAGFSPELEMRDIAANTVTDVPLVLLAVPERTAPVSSTANSRKPGPERPGAATPAKGQRFLTDAQGTVSDTQTRLMWMRCSAGQSWNGQTCIGQPNMLDWQTASRERNRGFAGFSDWRLPTLEELRSLVYCSTGRHVTPNASDAACAGSFVKPTIDPTLFPNTVAGWYWSSTSFTGNSMSAWYVSFSTGESGNYGTGNPRYVRFVRDAR